MTTAKAPRIAVDDMPNAGYSEADLDVLPREPLGPTIERLGQELKIAWAESRVECLLTAVRDGRDGVRGG